MQTIDFYTLFWLRIGKQTNDLDFCLSTLYLDFEYSTVFYSI